MTQRTHSPFPHPLKRTTHPKSKAQQHKESGYTLMVSIVLLVSVLLLSVFLASMVSVEVEKTETERNYTRAKANAKLAAMVGMELVQITTGPDQRVTAPSSIWNGGGAGMPSPHETELHWVGAYHSLKRTWDPSDREWKDEGRVLDKHNGEWRYDYSDGPIRQQSWCVSGNQFKDVDGHYLNPSNIRMSKEKVRLHDGQLKGSPDTEDIHALAITIPDNRLQINNASSYHTRFAFAAIDEGVKSKIGISYAPASQYPGQDGGPKGSLISKLPLLDPRMPALPYIPSPQKESDPPSEGQEAPKVFPTPETLRAIDDLYQRDLTLHFTTKSMGVLADSWRSGLKKDLSRGLGDQFPNKLAGEPIWKAPLPQRGQDGAIQDFSYRSQRDKNASKNNPLAHRNFLRGPLWDIAHSWYSLYLPNPPYMAGFYGGVEDAFDPNNNLDQSKDLVGRPDDPTIYKYSGNEDNRGPNSSPLDASAPNLDPRSPALAQPNNENFLNSASSVKFFSDKPFWQHKDLVNLTRNGYPRGREFWRNENLRHPIAPVLVEYTLELGLFTVDATYLWDLSSGAKDRYYKYKCNDGLIHYSPRNPTTNPPDGCVFIGPYRTSEHPQFGTEVKTPIKSWVDIYFHLEKTRFRREIINELLCRGVFGDRKDLNSVLSYRAPSFKDWMYQNHPEAARRCFEDKDNTVGLQKFREEFFSLHEYLDIEKHSRGLREGNAIEKAAYAAMLDLYKPILVAKPTLVYWNPYNVQLNDVRPMVYSAPGNVHARWATPATGRQSNICDALPQRLLHLPDARIQTSRGPLEFHFMENRRLYGTKEFTWMSAIRTPFVDRFTNDFHSWYGFSIPRKPFPFYKGPDFRPMAHPNDRFRHTRNRLAYQVVTPHTFAPGEIVAFSPVAHSRNRTVAMAPGNEGGFLYSIPLSTRFLERGEVIQEIEVFNYEAGKYEYDTGSRHEARHKHAWEMESLVYSDRDTAKRDYSRPAFQYLGRADKLVPRGQGRVIPVWKTADGINPLPWEQYDWWGRPERQGLPRDFGGIRIGEPRADGTRSIDNYKGPGLDNPYMDLLTDMVSIEEQNHFYLGFNFRRKATGTAGPSSTLPLWIQTNARAHDILRNGETDYSPFGWEGNLLTRQEILDSVPAVTKGESTWGDHFEVGQTAIAMVDIPRQPMHSVGELTNANLAQYNLAPTFATGNSYASPFTPPNQAYATQSAYNLSPADQPTFRKENLPSVKFLHPFNHSLPDFSYQLNQALFDQYFFSTIPDWPKYSIGKSYRNPQFNSGDFPPFEDFDQGFVSNYYDPERPKNRDRYLPPNPRIKYYSADGSPPGIDVLHDMDTAAANLLVDGAFNVNSTSVLAWTSIFRSLRDLKVGSSAHPGKTPILRSLYPGGQAGDIWDGYPVLSDAEIKGLSEALVEEIKKRGPFPSLASFLNRALVSPQDTAYFPGLTSDDLRHHAFSGALQAALDKTVNANKRAPQGYGETAGFRPAPGSHWKEGTNFHPQNMESLPIGAGIPGWILQSDLLRPLFPILSARSDTFTILGYGDVKWNGIIRAKATCEMTIQRVPEYIHNHVVPGGSNFLIHNKAKQPWYPPDPTLDDQDQDRNRLVSNDTSKFQNLGRKENFQLGRRYKVVSFRWL